MSYGYDRLRVFICFLLSGVKTTILYIIFYKVKEQTKNQMEKIVFNDNKSAQDSIGRKERLYRVRAKMGKIQIALPHSSSKQKQKRINRMTSYSPRRIKPNFAILFKQARQVKTCQTYLQNRLQTKLITKKEPLTPKVFTIQHVKSIEPIDSCNKSKKLLVIAHQDGSPLSKKQNNIYKTIQIKIDGKDLALSNKQKLLTTLSQIILNQSLNKDHLSIEMLDESVIALNNGNCFDMSEVLLIGEMVESKQSHEAK